MAEKRFEQQAKELLNDFELSPTPAAWENIRKEIQPEERRRRFAFWWLLPALLIGGGMVYYASTIKREDNRMTVNKTSEAKSDELNENVISKTNEQLNGSELIKEDVEKKGNDEDAATSFSMEIVKKKDLNDRINKSTGRIKKANSIIALANNAAGSETNKTNTADDASENKLSKDIISSDKNSYNSADAKDEVSKASELKAKDESKTSLAKDSSSSETILALKVQDKKNYKWQFGVLVEGGIASQVNKFSSAKSYAVPNSLPGTGSSFANNTRAENKYQAGALIGVGIAAQKQLSKVVTFNGIVSYEYMTTTQRQTAFQDTIISNVFVSNELYNSTSKLKLHALNVFTGVSFKVLGNTKSNVKAVTGLENFILIAAREKTNMQNRVAIPSNMDKNIYSLSEFNKWQPHLRTGFTVELLQKNSIIQLSPFVRYSLKGLQKTSADKSRLFSAGLGVVYFF